MPETKKRLFLSRFRLARNPEQKSTAKYRLWGITLKFIFYASNQEAKVIFLKSHPFISLSIHDNQVLPSSILRMVDGQLAQLGIRRDSSSLGVKMARVFMGKWTGVKVTIIIQSTLRPRYDSDGRYNGPFPDLGVARRYHACAIFVSLGDQVPASYSILIS